MVGEAQSVAGHETPLVTLRGAVKHREKRDVLACAIAPSRESFEDLAQESAANEQRTRRGGNRQRYAHAAGYSPHSRFCFAGGCDRDRAPVNTTL